MNLLGLGKEKGTKSATESEFMEQFQELCDQAELAEDVDEHKAINKSILGLIGGNLESINKAVKKDKKQLDETDDEDDDVNINIDQDGDDDDEGADDDDDLDARIEASKKAMKAKGKIKKSVQLNAPELIEPENFTDAAPLIESINKALTDTTSMIRKSAARTSRLEGRFDEFASNLTPLLEFVEESRRGGVATPQGAADAGGQVINKGLTLPTGAKPVFDTSGETEETLRGLTTVDIIKGVYQFLGSNPKDDLGLSTADINEVGQIPMSELNPKMVEVAAKELGIELKDK